MRLAGIAALVVPAGLLALLIAEPRLARTLTGGSPEAIAAVGLAFVAGLWLAGVGAWIAVQIRFRGVAIAAERLAKGELDVAVAVGSGMAGRMARAVNAISGSLIETTNAATVDRLTGVANRQVLIAHLFNEVERAARYSRPLSVAFVDIDLFKQVNDSYGHAVGDVVLRGVARTIREHLRTSDLVGRYGGEEFMLVLAETNVEDGAQLAEKLRNIVGRQRFEVEGNPAISVTISIGVAGGVGGALRVDSLVRDADAAMYSAKSLGRNQTYVFAEPSDDARIPRAPISPHGRARALEVGRAARDAAQLALASVIADVPHYRGRPSALIATVAAGLAAQLDLPEAEVERLRIAALLHDIGKVAVPNEVLEKPGPLTPAEWRTVVQHPRIGQVILEQAAVLKDAIPIILHHHERYSGHGYPFGLRGNDIPLGARIVAIGDAYDAMIHDRPYKRAMDHESAIREIRRHAGTQFDPALVTLFCDLYAAYPPTADPLFAALIGGSLLEPYTPPGHPPRRRRPPPSSASSSSSSSSPSSVRSAGSDSSALDTASAAG